MDVPATVSAISQRRRVVKKNLLMAGVASLVIHLSGAAAQPITIPMTDGHLIAGSFEAAGADATSVLLLHQCNSTSDMWEPVVSRLKAAGYSSFTVDFRGFGRSKNDAFDAEKDYDSAVEYFRDDIVAIDAAWRKLTDKADKRAIVGASCGGAMASILASQNDDIEALLLFSPSLRPFWFPEENWGPLQARIGLPVLGIASEHDTNALKSAERVLETSTSDHSEMIRYKIRLHGEPLFAHDTNLADKMVNWLSRVLDRTD